MSAATAFVVLGSFLLAGTFALDCPPQGTQGRTWLDVEKCQKGKAEDSINRCMQIIKNTTQRAKLRSCLEVHKKNAFAKYDSCLDAAGVCKTIPCSSLGDAEHEAHHAHMQNHLNDKIKPNVHPHARQALDCFNAKTKTHTAGCRAGCSSSLANAAAVHGDKMKQCYTDLRHEQHDNIANCINQLISN